MLHISGGIGGGIERDWMILLFSGNSDGCTFDTTIVLDTLGILRTVFDCMSCISIGSTERTGVGSQNWTSHFSISIFEVVRRVKTLTLSIIATKHTHLGRGEERVLS